MPTKIYNAIQLKEALKIPIELSIKHLGDIVRDATKTFIQNIVYDPYEPKRYVRVGVNKKGTYKGSFIGSWIHEDFGFRTTIFSDWESMVNHDDLQTTMMVDENGVQEEDFTHGSEHFDPTDMRQGLARIINEGKSGRWFGAGYWRDPRNFWDPTLEYVKNDILKKDIKDVFAKNKIILV